jgi:NADH dehydrogenase
MRIVIVGGGFAGLNVAKSLSRKKGIELVLVDQNNYHFFPPLIYQVATSFIEPSNISYPFRKLFQESGNVFFFNGRLLHIDEKTQTIQTNNGSVAFDFLVLAMGTETNYFGLKNVEASALPMKTIDDALNLRNAHLLHLEAATRIKDPEKQKELTTIVIAGGGPTGVEVAGMLAEMADHIINKDYPELTDYSKEIYLIDAGPCLLSPMSQKAQVEAHEALQGLGVKIKLNVAVKDFINQTVYLSDNTSIKSSILVWASGVIAKEAPGLPIESIGKGRRILVNEHNKVLGTDKIFAIGDICLQLQDEGYPNGHPQVAQVAIQQGGLLAHNFIRMQKNEALTAFRYKDKGSMAIISKFKAVVDLPKGFFKGIVAWLAWLFIHILPIAGFRNKFKLAFNWFWSFMTNDPTLRLVIRPKKIEK